MKTEYKCSLALKMPPNNLTLSEKLDWLEQRFMGAISRELISNISLLLINEMPIEDHYFRFTLTAESFPSMKALQEQEIKDYIAEEFC